jgi:phosphatidylglycerophosphate synthase
MALASNMSESAPRWGAKTRDYWWTVLFTDPIAVPLVRLLARSGVSPDQISVLAIVLGVAVGPLFALGTRAGFIAGALTFYAAFTVDCIDGKLARAAGVTSEKGAALDRIGDAARRGSASLGMLLGVSASETLDEYLAWAVVYVVLAYVFLELSGAEAPAEKTTASVDFDSMSPWARWFARRRLLPTPGMPDAQAVVFILGPLTTLFWASFPIGIALVGSGVTINMWRRLRLR